MILHQNPEEFNELIELTSQRIHIPTSAIRKDYFITKILNQLSNSEFIDCVVFKGGTSLSKCYPDSINRFSEDIDLTYIPQAEMTNNQINKKLKTLEILLIGTGRSEKVVAERNTRNKSSYVWFNDEFRELEKVKLEIGSSVRPHPFSKKILKSYIHEQLEFIEAFDAIIEYQLVPVEINVLEIQRTFIDKLFAVKRHAICGTLSDKVRHIYDVTQLFKMAEIQSFVEDQATFKTIVRLTKDTDSIYLEKRDIPAEYNPLEEYDFEKWVDKFNIGIKSNYEKLHLNLLYTDEKQNFEEAIETFRKINFILKGINE